MPRAVDEWTVVLVLVLVRVDWVSLETCELGWSVVLASWNNYGQGAKCVSCDGLRSCGG